MQNPFVRDTVAEETATIAGGQVLHTWDDLLGRLPGVIGVKTGHTNAAGWCQVAAVRGPGGTIIYATILGEPSRSVRNADLTSLLVWAERSTGSSPWCRRAASTRRRCFRTASTARPRRCPALAGGGPGRAAPDRARGRAAQRFPSRAAGEPCSGGSRSGRAGASWAAATWSRHVPFRNRARCAD